MAHARLSSFLVIALLQLSQTEISSTLPESWYAANVINDGAYSPKPISEIFSTPASFSSTNPIIVLSSTSTPESMVTPSTPSTFPSSWSTTFGTDTPATEISVVPLPTEAPQQIRQSTVSTESPPITIVLGTQTPQTDPPRLPTLSTFQTPPAPPSPPPVLSTPQQIQIQTAPQGTPPPPGAPVVQYQPPNYFYLYQQAPQTVQGFPQGPPQAIPSVASPAIVTSTLGPPVTTSLPLRPTQVSSAIPTQVPPAVPTQSPCINGSNPIPQLPSFKIRLVSPYGSITKVKINPPITTTTRRPTTTRRKRNRNNYDGCVSGCGGRKVPICASPLGVTPINPDELKGFPSVCHMACHNSFRKNLYQKVVDGRCGRLRTQIRPLDSNNKLKKDDLNKASYTVVEGSAPAVIEFSSRVP